MIIDGRAANRPGLKSNPAQSRHKSTQHHLVSSARPLSILQLTLRLILAGRSNWEALSLAIMSSSEPLMRGLEQQEIPASQASGES